MNVPFYIKIVKVGLSKEVTSFVVIIKEITYSMWNGVQEGSPLLKIETETKE